MRSVKGILLVWRSVTDGLKIASLTHSFPSLTTLTASYNSLRFVEASLGNPQLQQLALSYNEIVTLQHLQKLAFLTNLTKLSLRGNPITDFKVTNITFPSLKRLDVSSTQLSSFASLNPIPVVFPKLTHLLTQRTPLSKLPSASLHTIARLRTLVD